MLIEVFSEVTSDANEDHDAFKERMHQQAIADDLGIIEYVPATGGKLTCKFRARVDDGQPPVPPTISRRQFYTALVLNGRITETEFADVFRGELPAALASIVSNIPDMQERIVARGMLLSAQEFQRNHPLVDTFRAANAWDASDVDNFFRAAAAL